MNYLRHKALYLRCLAAFKHEIHMNKLELYVFSLALRYTHTLFTPKNPLVMGMVHLGMTGSYSHEPNDAPLFYRNCVVLYDS